jgi:RsiW-degrading membrane proteinase PrsW (M82 family)
MAKRPGGMMVQETEATRSQLIPLITKWEEIGRKAQLGPILFCLAAYFSVDFCSTKAFEIQGFSRVIYTSPFLIWLAFLLTAFSFYFIYRIVGKNKSWWILLAAFAACGYFLWLYYTEHDFSWVFTFFHEQLAGEGDDDKISLVQWIVGTGFSEELIKGIPVLILAGLGAYMSPSLRSKIGVEEPLDGILIGCAAAGGFAIVETLLQYLDGGLKNQWIAAGIWSNYHVAVYPSGHNFTLFFLHVLKDVLHVNPEKMDPKALQKFLQDSVGLMFVRGKDITNSNTTLGVPYLISRSIDQVFGHMAYSGYFGYFIGLSVLRPAQRWKILAIGLVSASIPHAIWDWVQDFDKPPLTAASAILSYAVLAAAILKAREISPNRAILQPSILVGTGIVQPSTNVPVAVRVSPVVNVPVPAPPPLSPPARGPAMPAGSEVNGSGNRLRVGSRYLIIAAGLRLLDHQVPGLVAQTHGGPVAEVTRNPNDPAVLGLTNLSTTAWETVTASGTRRQIAPGQTIKLAPGTRIDFGATDGEVA